MPPIPITVVFVHGYSVTNLDTYGELPLRLKNEAEANGFTINVQQIFLGRYISFDDVVELKDISRAFNAAVEQQLNGIDKFICITHSTGGPVVRDWLSRYYSGSTPPLTHLIMLAPANFGSALAQLGKGKLSRIKSWCDGVEPGQKVLDWLELGSIEAWSLNLKWIESDGTGMGNNGPFPFVIVGQSIDRKLYDHLNNYTGELGSDGVVRTATTNLNSRYIKLKQDVVKDEAGKIIGISPTFSTPEYKESPSTPLRVVHGKSHSGDEMGIMKSVKQETTDDNSKETVNAIFDCMKVNDVDGYKNLIKVFDAATTQVQQDELIETETVLHIIPRHFIHDRFSQVIFRVTDSEGYPVTDFDLILTAGEKNDPNHLPEGFLADRQQNTNNPENITYFFNYDVMKGAPKNEVRDAIVGTTMIGLKINPRPNEGFVRFVPCEIIANTDLLTMALKPNSTTLIDIILQRVVSSEVFRMETTNSNPDFKNTNWNNGYIVE